MQKQPLILLVINMQVRYYVSRTSPQNNSEIITNVEGRDISPEQRQKTIDDMRSMEQQWK